MLLRTRRRSHARCNSAPSFVAERLERRALLSFSGALLSSGAPVAEGSPYAVSLVTTGTDTLETWSVTWRPGVTVNYPPSQRTVSYRLPDGPASYRPTATASARTSGGALRTYNVGGIGLDPAFGPSGDGKVTGDLTAGSDLGYATALQPDGKIVVAGVYGGNDFAVIRYTASGALDPTFSGDGILNTNFGGPTNTTDKAFALAIDSQGRILAAGSSNGDFAVARYNPNGGLDTTFDGDGLTTVNFGNTEEALALAIDSLGRIVMAGYQQFTTSSIFAVARLNANGALDSTFSGDGRHTFDMSYESSYEFCQAVLVQSDRRIVLGGYAQNTSTNSYKFAVARLTEAGAADPTFDGDGYALNQFVLYSSTVYNVDFALALQPDDKILAAGSAGASSTDFVLARYNPNGGLDSTFGNGAGFVTTDFNGRSDTAYAMALQGDGRIVLAGVADSPVNNAVSNDFALARYNANGSLDNTFGVGGKLTLDFAAGNDVARGVAVTPAGDVVAAGWAGSSFALAKWRADNNAYATDVAPTVQVNGAESAVEGVPYTLSLSVTDPGDDPISSWEIDWGDGNVEPINGNPSSASHPYESGWAGNTMSITARAFNGDAGNWSTTIFTKVYQHVAPTIVQSASATPNPVTGTTTNLTVLAAAPAPWTQADLTYSWWFVSLPPGANWPMFSANSSNATATFYRAGAYTLRSTVTYPGSAPVYSDVMVTVAASPSSVAVSPDAATVAHDATRQFSAAFSRDQFGNDISPPPSVTWSVEPAGLGTVDTNGLFTAAGPSAGSGTVTVRATSGSVSGTASVDVGGWVMINFDELAPDTVVTNQYAYWATFSADAGITNKVLNDRKAVGGTPLSGNSYNRNLYVQFAAPVNGLRFASGPQENTGQIAQVRVFENGSLKATVPIIGLGGGGRWGTTDLRAYKDVTRIEIINVTNFKGLLYDDFRFVPPPPDLDVDSDNDNGFAPPARTDAEDQAEDVANDAAKPGKIIAVNDDDGDGDFIPDFADGFNHFGETSDRVSGELFVPLVLELPVGTDSTRAMVKFLYEGSDPAAVGREGQGTPQDPYRYAAAPGDLRIWAAPGDMPRSELPFYEGGNYIPPNVALGAMGLGFAAQRAVTFYVEAITPGVQIGDRRIKVVLDPDGDGPANFVAADAVRLTAVDVDVLIGADSASDFSLRDDWVGADTRGELGGGTLHKILNFLRLQGPPQLQLSLTVDWVNPAANSLATITIEQPRPLSITTDASGIGSAEFVLSGGNVSLQPDDVVVRAAFAGQVLGSESITVMRFRYEEEVASQARFSTLNMVDGNYVVNPAVRRNPRQVFAFDVGVGSAPATDARRHDATYTAGVLPVLNGGDGLPVKPLQKFTVQDIEVMFSRQIRGATAGSGLERLSTDGAVPNDSLAVAPRGLNGSLFGSNLRFTDTATTGTGVDGNEYVYRLGHPTERLPQIPYIVDNYVKQVVVPTKADLTYNVNVVLMQFQPATGPLQTTTLSPAEVQRLVAEASSLWEQVGVRLVWKSTTVVTTTTAAEWDLPDDGWPTVTAVTKKSRANGLDVFVVNSILQGGSQYISGKAAHENSPGVGARETGVLITRRKTSPTSAFEDVSMMARTMAHEIGHLLFNSVFDDHDQRAWNLMRAGALGSSDNADLTLTNGSGQTGSRASISILPDSYDVDETW
jgi:uncharacterized delta-60 repeat protein